ncbi:tRNA pseudouridine(55) synthase TruB [Alkalicoccobacillus plakortidis]|uniref:tRNA pseudouridine synthase B n=1 Tax=Alkalicoccobacillus plakortidis TaxID=444060 RepID=A0ABT0XFZ5_9BACI|nr:tRNA pseudouridine(55) synthase TruB [Alkalicoccobacillus plakortidis]MCM2674700.1 tRNA pseudouridine(55) synthase TruB [Alkalicoccobacillus plakortidis]
MPTGILPLIKPAGMTSHDCVYRIRKLYQTKKVGHTGTLDPSVTGVLPICIGRATKVAEYMSDFGKTYEAELTLGYTTTTEDADGEIVEQKIVDQTWTEAEIKAVLNSFLGEQIQVPPMYSAVKVNGKRLYEYARANQEVERPKRQITIHSIELIQLEKNSHDTYSIRFAVTCSKGTYIRTLAVAIGEALGYPAHMSKLKRTASGPFTLADCVTLEQLEQMELEKRMDQLLPFERALTGWKTIQVPSDVEARIRNGAVLSCEELGTSDRVVVYSINNELLAIYKPHPEKPNKMKPEKILFQAPEQVARKEKD